MKNKHITIGIIAFLLILGLLIYLLIISNNEPNIIDPSNNNQNTNNSNNSSGSSSQRNTINYQERNEKRKTLSAVTDYSEFFTINYYVNDIYQKLDSSDYDGILDVLDPDYKTLNKVDKSNIKELITQNIEVAYITHNVYIKGKDNIVYYFIDGEEQYTDYMGDGAYSIKDDVYYMIVLDEETKSYSIRPLKVDNLFNYAQGFSLNNNKKVKSTEKFYNKPISDETISLTYLNYFKSLLIIYPEKAYNMLDDNSRSKYNGYEDFKNQIHELAEGIPSSILNYSAKGDNGKRYYSVICTNSKVIDFKENGIMDFKVIL